MGPPQVSSAPGLRAPTPPAPPLKPTHPENAVLSALFSAGTLRSYQLWADNLKKGGGALLHSVKAKTQPAVRNMYRSVRLGWTDQLPG